MAHLRLASTSPRRLALLQQIGVLAEPLNPKVPEARAAGETPEDYVQRLAKAKALACAQGDLPSLGADTLVLCDGLVLEKPRDQADGLAMLARLSGRGHEVLTGVFLAAGAHSAGVLVRTQVQFHPISPEQALAYWQTGEPRDKAGGYGIQGFGAVFVAQIVGSYSNVVGLPLAETAQLLQAAGVPIWQA